MPWLIVAGLGGLGFVIREIRGAARDVQAAAPGPGVWIAVAVIGAALLNGRRR
jgi:hypothetical protein